MSAGKPTIYTRAELLAMIQTDEDKANARASQELEQAVYRALMDLHSLPAEVAAGAIQRALARFVEMTAKTVS